MKKALFLAYFGHIDTNRLNGDPYIYHPLSVMKTLKELGCDKSILEPALLHDVVEEGSFTTREIFEIFGKKTGTLVYALTKEPSKFIFCWSTRKVQPRGSAPNEITGASSQH